MRKKLAPSAGERKKFKAVFSRTGKKTNYTGFSEDTILLTHITDVITNEVVSDHCWFSYTKGFEKINLSPGIAVEFEARVKIYEKGYVNRSLNINNKKKDFKLSHPTKIKLFEVPKNKDIALL